MKLEKNLEELVKNFPNFIDKNLREMRQGKLGDRNVYLRQVKLPGGEGIIDLAFVTDTTVYLVEMKKYLVNEGTLQQLRRYREPLQLYYPDHEIRGFLVGVKCPDRSDLEQLIGDDPIKVLTLPRDIPWPTKIVRCDQCGAGASSGDEVCPYCSTPLF